MQSQMQSLMLTNKSIENEGPSENMGFNGKNSVTIQDNKKIRNIVLELSEKPSRTQGP